MSTLWVATEKAIDGSVVPPSDARPASVADLVAALIAEGGTVYDTSDPYQREVWLGTEGRWLVVRLPDEGDEA